MKKVLFVIYSMKFGGAERSLANLMQELPEGKYEADLLLFQKKGEFLQQIPSWINVLETPEEIEKLYAPLRKLKVRAVYKVFGTLASRVARRTKKSQAAWRWKNVYSRKIKKLAAHYDVAVAYAGSENLYFVNDKVEADRKLVWIHNDYRTAGYSKRDDLPYLEKMDAIVSVSEKCVNVLCQEFPMFADKLHYIENITSSRVIKRQAAEYIPEELEGSGYKLLSIGRLHPQKGFDIAIEAAAIMRDKGLDFSWYVLGEGSLKDELEERIKALRLEEHFVLLGTRRNPYPYIEHSDLVIQSSRYEGKSVVLDEAKILATPIVATAYPTVADQVKENDEGLITGMSAEALAEGILRLLEDKSLYSHIRNYLGSNEYGNESEVHKYMKLIDGQ